MPVRGIACAAAEKAQLAALNSNDPAADGTMLQAIELNARRARARRRTERARARAANDRPKKYAPAVVVALAHTLLRQSGLQRNADRSSASLRHRLTLHRVLDPYAVLDKALGKKDHSFWAKSGCRPDKFGCRQLRAQPCASGSTGASIAPKAGKWRSPAVLSLKRALLSPTAFKRAGGTLSGATLPQSSLQLPKEAGSRGRSSRRKRGSCN